MYNADIKQGYDSKLERKLKKLRVKHADKFLLRIPTPPQYLTSMRGPLDLGILFGPPRRRF